MFSSVIDDLPLPTFTTPYHHDIVLFLVDTCIENPSHVFGTKKVNAQVGISILRISIEEMSVTVSVTCIVCFVLFMCHVSRYGYPMAS